MRLLHKRKKAGHIFEDTIKLENFLCKVCQVQFAKKRHLIIHNAAVHSMIVILKDLKKPKK